MSIEERITALKTSKHHAVVEQIDQALEDVKRMVKVLQETKNANCLEFKGKGSALLFREIAPEMFDLILANATTHINVEIDVRLKGLEDLVK